MNHKSHRFSSTRFFELPLGWTPDPEKLKALAFLPTGPTQELSEGFEPPRMGQEPGDYPFVEVVSGVHVVRLRTQTRSVPKSALDHEVDQACERIEAERGRKPGKKEKKELQEEARLKLLPRAFTKDTVLWGMVFPDLGVMAVNSASINASSRLTSCIVTAHVVPTDEPLADQDQKFRVREVRTATSAEKFMLQALLDPESVEPFGPATYCVLVSQDELRRQVSYKNHQLQGNKEVQRYLKMGHMPTKLGIVLEADTYFEIDKSMGLAKVQFSTDLFNTSASEGDHQADAFDADIVLVSGGLRNLYTKLAACTGVQRLDDPSDAQLV